MPIETGQDNGTTVKISDASGNKAQVTADGKLKVDAAITANISGAQEVIISDTDDSIKIGDGTGKYANVSSTRGLKVEVQSGDGSANQAQVTSDGAFFVDASYTQSFPLPDGAASDENINAKLDQVIAALPIVTIDGRALVDGSQVTQPISASSLPLPDDAATATQQANQITLLESIDIKVTDLSTSAKQDTGNASLASIDSKFGDYATRLDDTSTANVTYVGTAAIGQATSSATWKIKKIDTTSGVVITWADSNNNYDNVWNNRTSLTYG